MQEREKPTKKLCACNHINVLGMFVNQPRACAAAATVCVCMHVVSESTADALKHSPCCLTSHIPEGWVVPHEAVPRCSSGHF